MKIVLLVLGVLVLIAGIAGVMFSFLLSYNASFPCQAVEDSNKRIERLRKENDPDNLKLIEIELTVVEVAQRECDERQSYVTLARIVSIPIALIGFLMLVGGLMMLIRKKKPAMA